MKKISDALRQERIKKNITLEEAHQKTKIKLKYLKAIEEGDFKSLPSKAYAQGFVKNYAKFLEIPTGKAMPLLRREYEENKREEYVPKYGKSQVARRRSRIFSPQTLLFAMTGMIILGYLVYQFSSVFLNPELTIEQPQNGSEVSGNTIEVKGKTDPSATVTVNGEDAFVAIDGSFTKSIFSFEGEETITVIAKNRYGKESKEQIQVTVREDD